MIYLVFFYAVTLVNCKSPHIIMIVADDMGFNDVSFHGSKQIPTPNIDKIAKEGVILNNYYVLPICTPSRSAIMTGRYPIHTGMQSDTIFAANAWGVGLDEKFLPQYLKNVGYQTHAIGKWHLGFFSKEYTPTYRGFDSFYGYYGGQADYWDHSLASNGWWGLDLHYDTPSSSKNIFNQWGNYSTAMYSMEAIDRIRNHNSTQPMFLYLAYQAVHSANLREYPLQAPQEWVDKFSHIKHKGRQNYAAMLGVMDHWIGQITSELLKQNMLDDSIIIFTSDNGGPANGLNNNWATNYPLRGTKTTVYEGGVRGAACIWSKELSKNPRVSNDLMHITDWLPTLLSAAGVDTTLLPNLDGLNLWDTLINQVPSPRTEVLINIDPLLYMNAALRVGDWKIVKQNNFYDGWYPPPEISNEIEEYDVHCSPPPLLPRSCDKKDGKLCLFNIKYDPCEYIDLSASNPHIYQFMLERLNFYNKSMVESRRNTFRDPLADPKLYNGVWKSWVSS
ncbi:arylsulfatase B isoform X1 [Hydra vulgaris]|uniref:arylsulfatase B isoform X1 n=2 Tax=Hydra vulgaris TaxID=6087 RepID=UPI001F5F3729|nr:arylsulfatase B isoform X1 [Hydra vulgaris]